MKYALNLAEDNRILSACVILPNRNYNGMPIVKELPDGNIYEYIYVDDEYIHNPLPVVEVEEKPSQLDVIEAQIAYTAMMTGTLLGE